MSILWYSTYVSEPKSSHGSGVIVAFLATLRLSYRLLVPDGCTKQRLGDFAFVVVVVPPALHSITTSFGKSLGAGTFSITHKKDHAPNFGARAS